MNFTTQNNHSLVEWYLTRPDSYLTDWNSRVLQGRKGKKKPSESGIDWDREKEIGVKALLHLVTPNIHRLWDPPIVEEEFVT